MLRLKRMFNTYLIAMLCAVALCTTLITVCSYHFLMTQIEEKLKKQTFHVQRFIEESHALARAQVKAFSVHFEGDAGISLAMHQALAQMPQIKLVTLVDAKDGHVVDEYHYSVRDSAVVLAQYPVIIQAMLDAPQTLSVIRLPHQSMPSFLLAKPIVDYTGNAKQFLIFAIEPASLWRLLLEEQAKFNDQIFVTYQDKVVFANDLHAVNTEQGLDAVFNYSQQEHTLDQLHRISQSTTDLKFLYAAALSTAGGNFLDKCYAWVMTQEDMAGSIAV